MQTPSSFPTSSTLSTMTFSLWSDENTTVDFNLSVDDRVRVTRNGMTETWVVAGFGEKDGNIVIDLKSSRLGGFWIYPEFIDSAYGDNWAVVLRR